MLARAARQHEAMPLAVGAGGPQMLATSPTTALARNIGEDLITRYGAVICVAPIISPSDDEPDLPVLRRLLWTPLESVG